MELDFLGSRKFQTISLINIFNESSYQLSSIEHKLLSLGYKYKLRLQSSLSENIQSWHRSVDRYQRQLNTQLYFSTTPAFEEGDDFQYLPRAPSTWSPPLSPYSNALTAYIKNVRRSGIQAIRRKPV